MRVTAAGSLPGTDFRGALSAMAEALPEVLPLPELPDRGVGSDMVGRALGLIDGLGFDLQPAGWRLTPHAGADHRRARAQWRHDLDDAEELLQGFDGVLKVGVAGPWTLAACVERFAGDRLLADHGARRELAQALAAGAEDLRGELSRRVPAATLWLQVDEPSLVAVRAGAIPTSSGFSRHRSVDTPELVEALAPLASGFTANAVDRVTLDAAPGTSPADEVGDLGQSVLHCCAPGAWLDIARRAGFASVSVDAAIVDRDELAAWCDEQRGLILGVVDSASRAPQGVDALVRRALTTWRPLQIALYDGVLLGTSCGLAGWSRADVAPQLSALRRSAYLFEESIDR
ncbi:MAG TPA: hypothetical protein PKG51_04885 [Arachnia sp.]|nr:hypothetical protein [Arachnia sp.]